MDKINSTQANITDPLSDDKQKQVIYICGGTKYRNNVFKKFRKYRKIVNNIIFLILKEKLGCKILLIYHKVKGALLPF